uniref:Uncharacterized protein n=1 Tax=Populus trichocarpa TaxID=3694 RepID=A0A2K2BMT5_POPTR
MLIKLEIKSLKQTLSLHCSVNTFSFSIQFIVYTLFFFGKLTNRKSFYMIPTEAAALCGRNLLTQGKIIAYHIIMMEFPLFYCL